MKNGVLIALCGMIPCVGHASAQTSVDGVSFVDRADLGELSLGARRGGLCVIDYDNDGWMDLVVGDRGGDPNRLFRNVPDPARPGERTLVDVTAGSGLDDAFGTAGSSSGIVAADYDNDGDSDLFITGRDSATGVSSLLYRNDGVAGFTNVSVASGVLTSGENTWSGSWSDFDLDGDVDLLIGANGGPHPLRLLVNNGDGTFTDSPSLLPSVGTAVTTLYAMVWTDIEDDGDPDCLVLSAGLGALLMENVVDASGNRTLINGSAAHGFTILGPAPMGIATGDVDNDGDRDVAISTGDVGTYYRNNDGVLQKVTPFATMWGWGVTYFDVENDGDLDNYQCGSLGAGADFDALARNDGPAGWTLISEAMNSTFSTSQHAVRIDLENDGLEEIISQNPGHYVAVYRNVSEGTGAWIRVHALGDGTHVSTDAIGAVVRTHAAGVTRTRELTSGSSTTSTEDPRAHFGLGDTSSVDWIEVTWPRFGHRHARTDRYIGPFPTGQTIVIEPRCAADVNKDDFTDILDFLDYLDAFGACDGAAGPCQGATGIEADFDGIGTVDILDLLAFLDLFGAGCP
jgi:hypothetical protein